MEDPELIAAARVGLDEVPFKGIVEASLAGVYVVYDERFRYVNDTFAAMFGYRVDEMEGMHLRDLVTLDSGDDVMEKYHQRISGDMPSIRYTTLCRHKDGREVLLEIHGARVLLRGQPALSGMAVDITERVEREQQLKRFREQLRELAHYIDTSREEQRAAFARDVHDVLGGMLSSIKMDVARILRRTSAPELSDIQAIGTDLLTLTQETIDAARRIADESRPLVLDSLGLFAALAEMLEKFGLRSGVSVSFHQDGAMPALDGDCAMQCYRIVQEALTNVARHADARHVSLKVVAGRDRFELQLKDNGCGLSAVSKARAGIGLISMRERAREVGGELQLSSAPAGGTLISLRVPLDDPEQTS